jgi:hypothetical protein
MWPHDKWSSQAVAGNGAQSWADFAIQCDRSHVPHAATGCPNGNRWPSHLTCLPAEEVSGWLGSYWSIEDHILKAQHASIVEFVKQYMNLIVDYDFAPGALILMWDSHVESDLNTRFCDDSCCQFIEGAPTLTWNTSAPEYSKYSTHKWEPNMYHVPKIFWTFSSECYENIPWISTEFSRFNYWKF